MSSTGIAKVNRQTDLSVDLIFGEGGTDLHNLIKILEDEQTSFDDPILKNPHLGQGIYPESLISPLNDYKVVLNALQRDGFLPLDNQYSCLWEEAAPATELIKTINGPCLQEALEDVMDLDLFPISKGWHFSGAGTKQCQFILAHWQSNGHQIPILKGRFTNESRHEIQIQCQNLRISSGKLKVVAQECIEVTPPFPNVEAPIKKLLRP